MSCMLRAGAVLLAFAASLLAQSPAPPDSIARLIDLDGLPLLTPGVTCKQFASTDPAGRGNDHGNYLRLDGKTAVLAEMTGPGVIARLWSANAQGRLRVFFDGEQAPRIDGPFQDLFTGKLPPFCEPIAIHKSGGWISYFPIPYQKSCRVEVAELERPGDLYYQVQYLTYPAGTPLRTFTTELPAGERDILANVVRAWRNPELLPHEPAVDRGFHTEIDVPPGATRWVALDGPATLVDLRLRLATPTPEAMRGMLFEAAFDDREPTVRAPLGDFFGVGFGPVDYHGLLLGWDVDTGYCHLPMPYRKQARLGFHNATLTAQHLQISARSNVGEPAANAGMLHAEFRCVDRVGKELYEFASIQGAGKYIGITQAMQGVGDLWYLEGNEEFFADGATRPSILGTGSEDFYNGGWYWDQGPFALPLHGLGVKAEWSSNRTTPWRMQMMDAVPFENRLVARIEHGSSNQVRDAYYSSVAYWYGAPHAVRALPDAELRLPRLWVFRPKGFTPARALQWDAAPAVAWKSWEELTTTHRGLDRPLFQAFPVSYVEVDQPAVDARVAVMPGGDQDTVYKARFIAPYADRFRLQLRMLGVAAAQKVLLDGVPLALPAPSSPADGPQQLDVAVGALTVGEHELAFPVASGAHLPLGLDALRLLPDSKYVRTWWVGPPIDANPKGTVEDVMPEEAKFTAADFDAAAAKWKPVAADGDHLDLNRHVSPRAPMLAYLQVLVHASTARMAHALLGSDDGVRVWANGKLVWSHALHRPIAPDQDQFDIPLQAGWNRLLVKVKNDDGGYGVMLRLADPDGSLRFAHQPDGK